MQVVLSIFELTDHVYNYFNLELVKCFCLVSKKYYFDMRNKKWYNFCVSLNCNSVNEIKTIVSNFNFKKYSLVHLNEFKLRVTDEIVSFFSDCHTLNLFGCSQITDRGIINLVKCHTLILS